ncbi:alpha/beta hydrolase family protein [Synoicihabitans lomoniglobus]|uniref:Prolyl oligopeptidase family serine peptidase n=1 Tax=Synoicihabitans lomoniglobus TaxID=2909285 RepID=A0AAF0CPC5_9BACT|nr:prolyl oligopeptidase family serine peptidase [Opitutaceae bacterium LMO-M01]WED64024.1 prolyl oligopeptidase family serine peptidase [Opitutaceae bacterium LMO-M01]
MYSLKSLRSFRGAWCALWCVLAVPLTAQTVSSQLPGTALPEASPAIAFFRAPLLQAPALNRAGTHVAGLFSGGGETYQLIIKNLADETESFIGGSGPVQVTNFSWLDDTHIAYNLVTNAGDELGLLVVNINQPGESYPIYQYGAARIIGVPVDTPMKPLVWVAVAGAEGRPAVVEIDAALNSGPYVDVRGEDSEAAWVQVAERNEEHILRVVPAPPGDNQLGYLVNATGHLAYAYTSDNDNDRVVLNLWDGKGWVPSALDLDRINVIDVGDHPGELLVRLASMSSQPSALFFIDALTAEAGDLVLRDVAYDFYGSVYRDPASHAIVGVHYDRTGPVSQWFDEGYQNLQKILSGYFPGKVVRLLDGNESGNVMLVSVSSDREPVAYYTIDLAARTVGRLQSEAPWIDASKMAATSMFQFDTAEGQKLDAYITLPVGTTKDNPAPLVVLPHGGPWVRNTWGFDPEVQFLASRGYAVLQPNYRGSVGYDWQFPSVDRAAFGRMHDDVTRAVRKALRTGMIDSDRVAISGGGFGGYLALTGLVDEPDLYRCGISFAGIYDWARIANTLGLDRESDPVYGDLFKILGDPGRDAAKFARISPNRRLDKLRDPILIARQRNASPVETVEADKLIDALRSAGAKHQVFVTDGSLGQLSNRVALFERMADFLDANM